MNLGSLAAALGGLGLVLLGMGLLTDGLRVAAGRTLHRVLAGWTSTRLRGFATGVVLTAVVQSSSAITVATIGFVNAGVLTLAQSAWVVFGCNVGTTMTGWLVAWLGLRLKIEVLALPIVGIGMLLRLTAAAGSRRAGLGQALAGFGVLFLGLGHLKATFETVGAGLDLAWLAGGGFAASSLAIVIGALMTSLMQSSSAALAIALTAVSQGIVDVPTAGAIIIGANLGTTSTALLASIGATAAAKRVSALHVVFNASTAIVATMVLPHLLHLVAWLRQHVDPGGGFAVELALFHTVFNLLGVCLMWPFAGSVVRWLDGRFRRPDDDATRPRHLDDNVLPVPEVALHALVLETARCGQLVCQLAREVVARQSDAAECDVRLAQTRRLLAAIASFAVRLGRQALPATIAKALPQLIRVHERQASILQILGELRRLQQDFEGMAEHERARTSLTPIVSAVIATLDAAARHGESDELDRVTSERDRVEHQRELGRQRLLDRAVRGRLDTETLGALIQEVASLRRLATQAWKAAIGLHAVRVATGLAPSAAAAAVPGPEPVTSAVPGDSTVESAGDAP